MIPTKEDMEGYFEFVSLKAAPFAPINTAKAFHILHAALGLSTELLELHKTKSRENTIEECGDFLWYLSFLSGVLGQDPDEVRSIYDPYTRPNPNELTFNKLADVTEVLVSLIKKQYIYMTPVALESATNIVWYRFFKHLVSCGIELDVLMDLNRAKLDKRYKSKFTKEESYFRADKMAPTLPPGETK